MDFTTFVRKPFVVEAVEVTAENIEEIAKLVGELRFKDEKPYIHVNRNVVPGVVRVLPGYWMTRMGDNIRCYNARVFTKQFCPHTPEIESWVNYINESDEVDQAPVTITLLEETQVEVVQVEVVMNAEND